MNKKFICTVCGYIHEGPEPPERCPQCKVPASKFKELEETEGGLQFVQEHVIGIANEYGIDDEMRKDLNAHWNGECDVVWDTKTNLEKRMNAEAGACEDKFRIAKNAKAQGWDAIHDTVHEMAKDEARHGKGFEGLYNRYFKK